MKPGRPKFLLVVCGAILAAAVVAGCDAQEDSDRDNGREGDTGGGRTDDGGDRSSPPDSGSGDTGSSPAGSD